VDSLRLETAGNINGTRGRADEENTLAVLLACNLFTGWTLS
jgi:hypothetical protein